MEPATWLLLILGLALLAAGAELLVGGASRLARRFGISPLVVGLTVVAFGTSAPELVVSLLAGLEGRSEIALGNVVGSNILNVLFVLGLCALLRPLVVAAQLIVRDVPIMVGASVLIWLLAADGRIGRLEGAMLLAGLAAFVFDSIRTSRRESAAIAEEYGSSMRRGSRQLRIPAGLLVVAGLGLLVLGARLLVDSAVEIARAFGVGEAIIGLTVIAVGTSLPEVATSVLATLRGARDIAAGNVVGSNIFNLLGILGASALAAPGGLRVSASLEGFDIPVMTAAALACLPLVLRDHRLSRWEGALFLAYYLAYTVYLLLAARQHAALERFSQIALEIVFPLTLLVLLRSAIATRRAAQAPEPE